jgi:hypothetical protein
VPNDYLTDDDLRGLDLDPAEVSAWCPWATELVALDGTPCWSAEDLAVLVGEGSR